MKKFIVFLAAFFSFMIFGAAPARALTFDLIAPTGELTQGQDVQFTVNIDTEGSSLASTQIGMTYETTDLEYVSVAPGTSFTTVTADVQGDGKIIFTGTKTGGFTGSGSFAIVTFKIIATEPGSTQLCALFNPGNTPTPAPTSAPVPTALPTTGFFDKTARGALLGVVFFALSAVGFFVFKKI
ncbi:MAG: cohesin domain-containing protein [Patescibacteria group bacterium]